MSFKGYLGQSRALENPRGDFIRDARADEQLPEPASWEELRGYFESRGACEGTLVAARAYWREYQRAERRRGQHA